jgi:ribosome maturation factor RimP
LNFPQFGRILYVQTNLSASLCAIRGGGEISGLTAHFFFGAKSSCEGVEIGWDWPESGPHKLEKMAVKLDEIRKAADRVAASLGLDVVDVEFTGTAKSRTLCIYLEKNAKGRAAQAAIAAAAVADPEAAAEAEVVVPERFAKGELNPEHLSWLTHEDCAEFSRDFGTLLDVEDLIPDGEYTLEASSPGLDRKLARREDFERFQGCLAKLQTFEPIANNRHWQGRLKAAGEQSVTLDLTATKQNSKSRKAGVSTVEIALGNIEKAHLVPEF